jgi:hypothetical protein
MSRTAGVLLGLALGAAAALAEEPSPPHCCPAAWDCVSQPACNQTEGSAQSSSSPAATCVDEAGAHPPRTAYPRTPGTPAPSSSQLFDVAQVFGDAVHLDLGGGCESEGRLPVRV